MGVACFVISKTENRTKEGTQSAYFLQIVKFF